ncbi:MAG: hypothetical protein M1827_007626 [Pycnora praestabilis]|nr:MAG: hypothetical protein M1827_007626 [Pycnora praestabilis]
MVDNDTSDPRAALTARQIPTMTLSTGTSSSLTGPPPPMPHYLNAAGRAERRFAVEGNAISTIANDAVTGGTGTLALESARALLEHGLAGLCLWDINSSQLAPCVSGLKADFPSAKIIGHKVDVTNGENVKEAVGMVVEALGSVDILCCFAGVVGCVHALDLEEREWRRTLDVNTTGAFLCAQACARQMKSQQTGGSVLLTASISAHRVNYPQPQSAYNVSKAALLALSHSLAAEWAHLGIRVNTISPGYMDTILNEGEGLEEARRVWRERNPMGRMGQPSEITGVVVLLCGAAGTFVNGADFVVDGGAIVF